MEFRMQNSECRILHEQCSDSIESQLQPLHRTLDRRADLTDALLDAAVDRRAAQDHFVDS